MKIKTLVAIIATATVATALRDDIMELVRHIDSAELRELKDPVGLFLYLLTGVPREHLGYRPE